MVVEAVVGAMRGDVRCETSRSLEPIIKISTRNAAVLLVEVIRVVANGVVRGGECGVKSAYLCCHGILGFDSER